MKPVKGDTLKWSITTNVFTNADHYIISNDGSDLISVGLAHPCTGVMFDEGFHH